MTTAPSSRARAKAAPVVLPVLPEPKTITVSMVREKETPGTVRFMEAGEIKDRKIGTLYVPKATVGLLGNPTILTVTLTVAD